MRKKILIFSVAYPPFTGGAELAIKEITDRIGNGEFSARGGPAFDWDMITLRFDGCLPKFEKMGNVNVYRIGFTGNKPAMADLVKFPLALNKYLFPFIAYWKARKLHKKNKYDAIWAMMAAYAGFAALFFKIRHPKLPYLLTLQEGDPIEYIKKKVKFIYPLFARIFTKADFIQPISRYLAGWARDMGFKGEMEIVPNAVAIARFSQDYPEKELTALKDKLGKKTGDKYVITTSRLVLKNAVDDVIKSLRYLPDNVKFLVLGTGPDEETLKNLAREKEVDERVIWLGHIDHKDMPKYLKISDIFIRPSLSEGLGNSFLEAMAAKIPVIATQVGGIPDFLFDPEKNSDKEPTGLFCNVRDPKSIAEKIKIFLENRELTEKIKVNAKKLVEENYDWDLIANKMKNIFYKLCIF